MFALGFPELTLIIAAVTIITFEVALFINMLRSEKLSAQSKILWAFAFLFLQVIAAGMYYALSYSGRYSLEKLLGRGRASM